MSVSSPRERIDWEAVERAPEFQELVTRRRRFVLPATIFFLAWYLGFVLLAGYAPDFMGESIYQGFTVGYLLALTQFVMVWVLAAWYIRKSDREFDPLREAAKAQAVRDVAGQRAEGGARFERRNDEEVHDA
ncbi:MAG: hypothetical protein JWP17_3596 [Solirubrobacterales bacterium]|jgi:uncharacterized membrane protein (DUF485 family)|nr:hypothetical protein [Solirubrobacterales bacterium]